MKHTLFLFAVLLIQSAVSAQQFVLDGVKNKNIFGLIEMGNDTYGLIYKDADKKIVLQKLDKNLKPLDTSPIGLNLGRNDVIDGSYVNGKTILLKVLDYKGNFSNGSGYSAGVFDTYFTTINPDNSVAGVITYQEYIRMTIRTIVPDPNSSGYYVFEQQKIIKFNNQLKKVWEYEFPKGYHLLVGGTPGFSSTNLYGVDSLGICLVIQELKKGNIANKTAEKVIRLSSARGTIMFEKSLDVENKKTLFKLTIKDQVCYLNGITNSLFCLSAAPTGLYQIAIDASGKVLSEKTTAVPGMAGNFCDGKWNLAYYRDMVLTENGWVAIFEKAKTDEYLIYSVTDKGVKEKIVDRNKSDLGTALSLYAAVLSGGKKMNKLFNNDYVTTIPLDSTGKSFGLIYQKTDVKATENQYEYRMAVANLGSDTQPSEKLLAKYKDWDVFFKLTYDKLYMFPNWEKGYILMGYSMEYDNKFIIKKMSF